MSVRHDESVTPNLENELIFCQTAIILKLTHEGFDGENLRFSPHSTWAIAASAIGAPDACNIVSHHIVVLGEKYCCTSDDVPGWPDPALSTMSAAIQRIEAIARSCDDPLRVAIIPLATLRLISSTVEPMVSGCGGDFLWWRLFVARAVSREPG